MFKAIIRFISNLRRSRAKAVRKITNLWVAIGDQWVELEIKK